MSREERSARRKADRQVKSLASKAKADMTEWAESKALGVTEQELVAWKAGYLAGFNRAFELASSK